MGELLPEYVEGVSNLAHKIVDLTDCRGLVLLVEMERRVFCVVVMPPRLAPSELRQ